MTQQQAADREWSSIEAYFKSWAATRGRLIVDRTDQLAFGNRLLEAAADDLRVRLIRDRGTVMLDVATGQEWHSGRTILAFVEGRTPTMASTEPDGAVLTLAIGTIKQALADPTLAKFEDRLSEIALDRFARQAGRSRVELAASA